MKKLSFFHTPFFTSCGLHAVILIFIAVYLVASKMHMIL